MSTSIFKECANFHIRNSHLRLFLRVRCVFDLPIIDLSYLVYCIIPYSFVYTVYRIVPSMVSNPSYLYFILSLILRYPSGADPGFQVRGGAHLKKSRRAEGGAKNFGVIRVKNHDFTTKNRIFSNCGGGRENFGGISCEKSRFYAKKSYFFQF
jgi:hypothetical protein